MTHESLLSYSLRSRILAGRRGKIEAKVTDIPFLFADIAEVNIFFAALILYVVARLLPAWYSLAFLSRLTRFTLVGECRLCY